MVNCPPGLLRPITLCAINVRKPLVSLASLVRNTMATVRPTAVGWWWGAAVAWPGLDHCWCVAPGAVVAHEDG